MSYNEGESDKTSETIKYLEHSIVNSSSKHKFQSLVYLQYVAILKKKKDKKEQWDVGELKTKLLVRGIVAVHAQLFPSIR